MREKTFHRDELQLKLIAEYGGCEVENPYWTFKTFAVVTEEDGKLQNILTKDIYVDSSQGDFSREIGEERAFPPIYAGITYYIDFKEQENSMKDIRKAMKNSGLYFEDLSQEKRISSFMKSLKR